MIYRISDRYKKAIATTCNGCKIAQYETIAILLNKVVSIGKGEGGRGFNIYIHPRNKKPQNWHFVTWIPKQNHNH